MAWIPANDFYQRALLNDLVSLRALRSATEDLAIAKSRSLGNPLDPQLQTKLDEIDEAITATEKLLAAGAHHG